MRQTLFRILFNDLWRWETRPNNFKDPVFNGWGSELYIGAGWLLVPWLMVMAYWFFVYRKNMIAETKLAPPFPWLLMIFPAAILIGLPLLSGRLPQSAPIYGFGFMLFLAFALGGLNASHRAKKAGLEPELVWDLGMYMFIAGIIGCRVFHLVQYWDRNFGNKKNIAEMLIQAVNLSNGGMVLYGGAIAGLITYLIFCKKRKLNPLQMADVMMPSAFLGLCLGRIGCLMNGCCYGDFCSLPWAVQFPEGSTPWQALMRRGVIVPGTGVEVWLHPSQIYSSLNALLLYFVTASWFKVRPQHGSILAFSMIAYPITRFLLEFVRADELGKFSTSFTISQWVSLGVCATGIGFAIWQQRQSRSVVLPAT